MSLAPVGTMAAPAAGKELTLSIAGYMDCFTKGLPYPATISFTVTDGLNPPIDGQEAKGSRDINSLVGAALFGTFAERANEWIRGRNGTDYERWPPVSNFARCIRNAISHGQKVSMDNPNATGVSWRGNTISHADNGRKIIGTGEYGVADLILLMLDLDDELTALGAPTPLP